MNIKPSPEQVREWAKKAGAKFDPHWGIAYNTGTATFERFAELAAQWGAAQAQHEAENAPWLTTAHMICTDAGIAHGPISGRLEALRDKLADKAQQTTEETDAEMALRSIASWLGVGGFNAPTVDAKVFEQKIYEGVEMAIKSHYATAEEPELPEAVCKVGSAWNSGGGFDVYEFTQQPPYKATLFTAAQMHDHFAAGVRVGMGDSQWRTIDSAPKDGVKVLAFTNDGYKYPLVCQCVWGDGAWWPDAWESPDEPLKPTHWMPLPTPPAMQGGQK